MAGMTALDDRRIYYYLIWPSTFLSIHPDYLLVHRLEPAGAGHTRIVCDWLFEPATIAAPGFDPSDAIAFWDLTNRQDWHVCELQQRGTRSRSWVAGRYSNQEPSVHAFDLMAVDRYADDGDRQPADRPVALRRADPQGRGLRRRRAGHPAAALARPGPGRGSRPAADQPVSPATGGAASRRPAARRPPGPGRAGPAIELAAMLSATAAMIAVNSTPSIVPAATATEASTKLNSPI